MSSQLTTINAGPSAIDTVVADSTLVIPLRPIESVPQVPVLSRRRAAVTILCTTCITGIGSLVGGHLTICIPTIANDLNIPQAIQLWPSAAYTLASGCTLLPCGVVADVLGSRRAILFGALLQIASIIGAGLSNTSTQIIALRSVAGMAGSFCLPGAVGTVAHVFPADRQPRLRSIAFAAMGGGQAVGFGVGIVIGGVCADTVGWRWGFHAAAIANGLVLALAYWALPYSVDNGPLGRGVIARLFNESDWVGALLISTSLALLSYEISVASGVDARSAMRATHNIVLLCVAVLLLPVSSFWMSRQIRLSRPALIPNALWTNVSFTAICIIVFLQWGSLAPSEQYMILYLQDILKKSALTSSLYFLPVAIGGAVVNAATAMFLPHLRLSIAVPIACLISAVATVLLAVLCRVDGPEYWQAMFQATLLNPLSADMVYSIGNLVVTEAFPAKTQALAGGIFNMVAQVGKSLGVATTTLIAQQVTAQAGDDDSLQALLNGYKAGWWYNCAMVLASALVSHWGLKNVRHLGMKRD